MKIDARVLALKDAGQADQALKLMNGPANTAADNVASAFVKLAVSSEDAASRGAASAKSGAHRQIALLSLFALLVAGFVTYMLARVVSNAVQRLRAFAAKVAEWRPARAPARDRRGRVRRALEQPRRDGGRARRDVRPGPRQCARGDLVHVAHPGRRVEADGRGQPAVGRDQPRRPRRPRRSARPPSRPRRRRTRWPSQRRGRRARVERGRRGRGGDRRRHGRDPREGRGDRHATCRRCPSRPPRSARSPRR